MESQSTCLNQFPKSDYLRHGRRPLTQACESTAQAGVANFLCIFAKRHPPNIDTHSRGLTCRPDHDARSLWREE